MSQHEPSTSAPRKQHDPEDLRRDNESVSALDHKATELLFTRTLRNHFEQFRHNPGYLQSSDLTPIRNHLLGAWRGDTEQECLDRYITALQVLAPDMRPAEIETLLMGWDHQKRLANLRQDFEAGELSTENFAKLSKPKLTPRLTEAHTAGITAADIAPHVRIEDFDAELKRVSLLNQEKEALRKKFGVGSQSSGHGLA